MTTTNTTAKPPTSKPAAAKPAGKPTRATAPKPAASKPAPRVGFIQPRPKDGTCYFGIVAPDGKVRQVGPYHPSAAAAKKWAEGQGHTVKASKEEAAGKPAPAPKPKATSKPRSPKPKPATDTRPGVERAAESVMQPKAVAS